MSSWNLVRLNFGRSPAHFGEVGIGIEETSERARSDTLFSAWVSTYARLFGKDAVEDLLGKLLDSSQEPPFRLSSTFIYSVSWQGETPCFDYYLPKPLGLPKNYPQGNDLYFAKTYRKLNYLPLDVWQRWYQGEGFTDRDRAELIAATQANPNKSGALYQAGTFDYKTTYRIQQIPKVAIDRTSRTTNFYHTGFVQFQWQEPKKSGLYFLIHFPTADSTLEPNLKSNLESNLRAALELLGEDGIGGERSSGAGRFESEWLPLPQRWKKLIQFAATPTHHCLLSLFWSNEKTELDQLVPQDESTNQASYEIQERGGWITSATGHQRRRQMVRMFAEGSVFPQPPRGKLADVTPPGFYTPQTHRIYRSGLSLSLPIVVAPAVAPAVAS